MTLAIAAAQRSGMLSAATTAPLPRGYGSVEAPFGYDEKGYRYMFDPVAAGTTQAAWDAAREAERQAEYRAQGLLGARNAEEQARIDANNANVANELATRQPAGTEHTYYFDNGRLTGDTMRLPGGEVYSGPVMGTPTPGTYGGGTAPVTPTPIFTLSDAPRTTLAPSPTPVASTTGGGILSRLSSMLNANRPAEDDSRVTTGDLLPTGNSVPQILPTNNTTASAVSFDWKKYLPYMLGFLALVLLVLAMRRRRGGAA